jgi:hypothetical protein
VILTVISSTAPGGYAEPATTHSQFPVFKQDLDDSIAAMRAEGIDVILNWDARTLEEFARRHG